MYLENKKKFKQTASGIVITLILCCLSLNYTYAQVLQNKDTSSTDKVKVVNNNENYFEDKSDLWNVIKLNPLLIFSGEIPIYYERRLGEKTSVEVGFGPTIKDPTYSTYLLVVDDAAQGYYDSTRSKLGITFKSMFRYYPSGNGFPEGFYFGPELRYKSYGSVFDYIDANGGTSSVPLKRKYTDMLIALGDQEELDNNVYLDLYGGVGLRIKTVDRLESIYDNAGNRGYTSSRKSITLPLISLGIKIGFSF